MIKNPWFLIPSKAARPRMRLFCFAHAGGSPAVFHRWVEHLPEWLELRAVQLPGRGMRLREPSFRDLDLLVRAITPNLIEDDMPYVLFGHSLGATLAFEVARQLRREGLAAPERLFVSSRPSPSVPRELPPIHHLNDAQFLQVLRERYGEANDGLRHPELIQLMLPALKADLQMLETWRHREEADLQIPIHVYGADEDNSVSREHIERWREVAGGEFSLEWLSGDHFHHMTSPEPLVRAILSRISL